MPDTSTRSFPQASGRRLQWSDLPAAVRAATEQRLGSPVVAAHSQSGGFSPGVAARLELADDSRVFLKAVSAAQNPDSPDIHRREARIAAALPTRVPAPPLRWSSDDGEWVVLAFDDVDGRTPELPWREEDLERVLSALQELADTLTPSPIVIEPARDALQDIFGGWRDIAAGAVGPDAFPAGVRDRLTEFVELEAHWPEAVRGDALVHLDVRADNVLLTPGRVYFVDWPWAAVGASWLDLALMLPSVVMQGGPDPETMWRGHSLSAGVDDDDLDAFIAAFAGMLVYRSLQPPPPGIPTLRSFQERQAAEAMAWLARRRGWIR